MIRSDRNNARWMEKTLNTDPWPVISDQELLDLWEEK